MNTPRMYRSVRRLLTTCLLLTVVLTLAGPASVARAASYVVSNLNDSGPGSLRQAIIDSSGTAGADTITFSVSGTILLEETLFGVDGAGLTIDGAGQSIAISGNDATRVIINDGALALRNLTVTGGYYPYDGGGIYNGGTLIVTNSSISGNTAYGSGGGIYNFYGTVTVTDSTISNVASQGGGIANNGGTVTVTNSTFLSNYAYSGGGAVSNGGGTLTVSGSTFWGNNVQQSGGAIDNGGGTLEVTDSTFSGNRAVFGGGINNSYDGTLEVANSTFSGNTADFYGGGISSLRGTVTVTASTFSGNTAYYGGGGGILNEGTLTVADSTFSDNYVWSYGGGILNGEEIFSNAAGTLSVTNSTFSGNSTDTGGNGGGIFNSAVLDVTNSTFSGNSATQGGGIMNGEVYGYGNAGSTLTLTSSTLSGNFATQGSGIFNDGTVTSENTIVADSTGGNCANNGILNDGGGNLSWPDATCPGLNADPLLGPLQDNGDPTQTLALLPGSPAIDAAVLANCPATDQRGVSRPQGPGCDIGAFELEVVYNFSGYFQPVDNLPTWNVVRAGAGVPVRFSLGGDRGLNIFAAGYPVSKQTTCGSGLPQDKIEQTIVAGSSSLSYDAASDTYTYVWKTNKAWAGTCRQFIIKLNNGTEHRAKFKFVR